MNTHEKCALAAVLARRCKANPSYVAENVIAIMRSALRLHRIMEKECNGNCSPADQKAEKRAMRTISNRLLELGVQAELVQNGDPRGYPVFLVFKGEDIRTYSNDMGQRGYGIG